MEDKPFKLHINTQILLTGLQKLLWWYLEVFKHCDQSIQMEINFICIYFCCRIIIGHLRVDHTCVTIHHVHKNIALQTWYSTAVAWSFHLFNMTKPIARTYLCRKLYCVMCMHSQSKQEWVWKLLAKLPTNF